GGIYNVATTTLTDSVFMKNHAGSYGGGIGNTGTVNSFNSTLAGNDAANGGGIFLCTAENQITLTGTDSTISNNSATYAGGGIETFGNGTFNPIQMNFTNTTISGNAAAQFGGGFYSAGASNTVKDTIIAGNTAPQFPDIDGSYSGDHN